MTIKLQLSQELSNIKKRKKDKMYTKTIEAKSNRSFWIWDPRIFLKIFLKILRNISKKFKLKNMKISKQLNLDDRIRFIKRRQLDDLNEATNLSIADLAAFTNDIFVSLKITA